MTDIPASPPASSAARLGVMLMLLGMVMFSLNDVLGKWLVATYSVGQLMLIRSLAAIVDRSVDVLVEHVRGQHQHFAFIVRERAAGPLSVREEIRRQIELFERELATDLDQLPGTDPWSAEDLRTLSKLIVGAMVSTAEALLSAPASHEKAIAETARTQLRMVLVGALNWKSRA